MIDATIDIYASDACWLPVRRGVCLVNQNVSKCRMTEMSRLLSARKAEMSVRVRSAGLGFNHGRSQRRALGSYSLYRYLVAG